MDSLDYWRLCEELTIVQAALLIIGEDPSGDNQYVEGWDANSQPKGYIAAKEGISRALKTGAIAGSHVPLYELDINGNRTCAFEGSTDFKSSTVDVASLREWLRSRGFATGFFFPNATGVPDYLDPSHPRYARKLAACVNAWLSVTSNPKTSPKMAIEKWLRENAATYGMTDADGNVIKKNIKDCSTVANWNETGGAPKSS